MKETKVFYGDFQMKKLVSVLSAVLRLVSLKTGSSFAGVPLNNLEDVGVPLLTLWLIRGATKPIKETPKPVLLPDAHSKHSVGFLKELVYD